MPKGKNVFVRMENVSENSLINNNAECQVAELYIWF